MRELFGHRVGVGMSASALVERASLARAGRRCHRVCVGVRELFNHLVGVGMSAGALVKRMSLARAGGCRHRVCIGVRELCKLSLLALAALAGAFLDAFLGTGSLLRDAPFSEAMLVSRLIHRGSQA